MKKFLIIIALIIVAWIGYNLIQNQLIVISNRGQFISESKEESLKNGLFVTNFLPLKDSIQFNDRKIKADTAWSEVDWYVLYKWFFYPSMYKNGRGRNIILPIEDAYKGRYRYELINWPPNLGYSGMLYKKQYFTFFMFYGDTLKFRVESRINVENWQTTDTITYVASRKE